MWSCWYPNLCERSRDAFQVSVIAQVHGFWNNQFCVNYTVARVRDRHLLCERPCVRGRHSGGTCNTQHLSFLSILSLKSDCLVFRACLSDAGSFFLPKAQCFSPSACVSTDDHKAVYLQRVWSNCSADWPFFSSSGFSVQWLIASNRYCQNKEMGNHTIHDDFSPLISTGKKNKYRNAIVFLHLVVWCSNSVPNTVYI